MGNSGGDSSLGCSMTVVSSSISVTEMTGVVGVDIVVVFIQMVVVLIEISVSSRPMKHVMNWQFCI